MCRCDIYNIIFVSKILHIFPTERIVQNQFQITVHIGIRKFEVSIIFDGLICFFSSSIQNLDRDGLTLSWILLFSFGFCFLFSVSFFLFYLCFKKNLFPKTAGGEFDNSWLLAIFRATYRMDLVHVLREFFFIQPGFTCDCRDNPFAIFVICLIFSGLSEARYNRARSLGILISFAQLLR